MLATARFCGIPERSDVNVLSALVNLASASFAVSSLASDEWMSVTDGGNDTAAADMYFDMSLVHSDPCTNIGTKSFWSPARFGGFLDQEGRTHIAFHSEGRVLLDCISPFVANLFYALTAACLVECLCSVTAALLHLLAPPHPFLAWLRQNTIMEMCNMMLCLAACVAALLAQTELRPQSEVTVGPGLFLVAISGLFSFIAALISLRHSNMLMRMRRLDNQRILCARSLRSWRDLTRRPEDMMPIVDFERYLDSATSMEEMGTRRNESA